MVKETKQILQKPILWLAVLAALLYSSWPLGFILNPAVERHKLASQLEASHQPYNWVFITLDVLTGLVMLCVGILQLRSRHLNKILRIGVFSYMIFGTLVAVAALIPLHCDPIQENCGPLLHQNSIIIHGVSSIMSVVFLLIGLVVLLRVAYLKDHTKVHYALLMLVLLFWTVFGIASLFAIAYHIHNNFLQDYFITVCSISIIIIIATIDYLHSKPNPHS